MKKIRSIIVDDESRSISVLKTMLSRHCANVTVISEARSIKEGINVINKNQIELLFLDIELGLGSGFDLLGEIDNSHMNVIFITAYDTYAIKAIKWSAIDYLLKPIDPMELISAVKKVTQRLNDNDPIQPNKRNYSLNINSLALPHNDSLTFINIKDIIRLEAYGNYTKVFIQHATPRLINKPLKEYCSALEVKGFIRVHHKHLINLAHIKEYFKGRGGVIVMSDLSTVPLSVRKKDDFMKKVII